MYVYIYIYIKIRRETENSEDFKNRQRVKYGLGTKNNCVAGSNSNLAASSQVS
jgi:hypothetical protein